MKITKQIMFDFGTHSEVNVGNGAHSKKRRQRIKGSPGCLIDWVEVSKGTIKVEMS